MTPLQQQYTQIKKQFPDTIVFFRLGDFYETFNDDAKLVASVCNIVLTGREMGPGNRVPLAGVPYHAVDNYLAKLIQAGHKVAIVEQTSNDTTNGLMTREVVRVVTPGTIVEPGLLQAKQNNYLAAVVVDRDRAGIAYADITTGTFSATELPAAEMRQELDRLHPAEVLGEGDRLPDLDSARQTLLMHFQIGALDGFGLAERPLATRAAGAIIQYLQDNQKASLKQLTALHTYSTNSFMTLDPATRRNLELVATLRVGAVKGSLLGVLDETQTPMGARLLREWLTQPLLDLDALQARLDRVARYYGDTARRQALRQLFKGVGDLERLANRVVQGIATPRDLLAIRASLEIVPKILEVGNWKLEVGNRKLEVGNSRLEVGNSRLEGGNSSLEVGNSGLEGGNSKLEDDDSSLEVGNSKLEGGNSKLETGHAKLEGGNVKSEGAKASPAARDAGNPPSNFQLPTSNLQRPSSNSQPPTSNLQRPASNFQTPSLDPCPDVVDLVRRAISPEAPATLGNGGVIAPAYSAELDGIVNASRNAKDWVANLERQERERTGVKSLKVGYNKVFGYYIEVTTANLAQVPAEYIRKQTLVNAERFITPELKEYESLILNADERIVELQTMLFREVCAQVGSAASRLLATARAIAELDVITTLAEVAVRYRYVRPELNTGDAIHIVAGRHPVVELTLRDEPFVPNDVLLSHDEAIHIITGPNMSGKSTFLRQVALITLMAQIGSFVPAESAQIGLVDRIFTRIGAQDEIAAGQSTFMVEMVETANILTHSTSRSLIILDEVGRGTSTYDGIAIARAIVEHLHNHPQLGAKTLFATHYHELIELDRYLPRVRNYNVAVMEQAESADGSRSGKGGRVVFMHKIVRGGADRSYGIHVAQLAGIPKPVVHRAEEILQELERQHTPNGRGAVAGTQLPLFVEEDPLRTQLKELDVLSLSPLEALNRLFQLAEQARSTLSGK